MPPTSFSLRDNLVTYCGEGRAGRSLRSTDALEGAGAVLVLGLFEFADDDSVHADHWERHPSGDEVLCVLDGRLHLTVETESSAQEATLESGQAFIVPRARWHRLRVLEPGRLIALTPVAGTQLRAGAAGPGDGCGDIREGGGA